MTQRISHDFRLERILQHKQHIEEMFQQELAELQATLHQEYQVLMELQRQQHDGMAYLESKQYSELVDLATIAYALAFLNRLSQDIQAQASLVHGLLQRVDEKRSELVAASRECKMLEKLKARQEHLWKQHQKRLDAGAIDEIATQQFIRSQQL